MFLRKLKRSSRRSCSKTTCDNPRFSAPPFNATIGELLLQDNFGVDIAPVTELGIDLQSKEVDLLLFLFHTGAFETQLTCENHEALRVAAQQGFAQIVSYILCDVRADPTALEYYALRKAAANGHFEVVKLLLGDVRVCDHVRSVFATKWPLELGYIEPNWTASDNLAIRYACKIESSDDVAVLLTDEEVDPGAQDNYAFRTACEHGNVDIVQLLLNDTRVDPLSNNGEALILACETNKVQIVHLFLQNQRIDLSSVGSQLMALCCFNDLHDVARLLWSDSRMDQYWSDNSPTSWIRSACVRGSRNVFKLFLEHPKVDVEEVSPVLLSETVRRGNEAMAVDILTNPRLEQLHHVGILAPILKNLPTVVRLLVNRWNVDPSVSASKGLVLAAEVGSVEIVRFLLADPRIDPSAHSFASWWSATNQEVAKLLYKRIGCGVLFQESPLESQCFQRNVDWLRDFHKPNLIVAGYCLEYATESVVPRELVREILKQWCDCSLLVPVLPNSSYQGSTFSTMM